MTTTLLGYGSHGRDLETIWHRVHGDTELLIHDDDPPKCRKGPYSLSSVIVGVNDPRQRARMVNARHLRGAVPLIDPSAILGHRVTAHKGVVIGPRAVLLCDVELAEHVHVNYGASMTRTTVGAFTTICPGVTICGNVVIGEECLIGAGATICDRVEIGSRVVIGAGSVVLPETVVPDDTTVTGVWKERGIQ